MLHDPWDFFLPDKRGRQKGWAYEENRHLGIAKGVVNLYPPDFADINAGIRPNVNPFTTFQDSKA